MIAQFYASDDNVHTFIHTFISKWEEDDVHSYIKRPSKNNVAGKVLQKNNRDGLRHRGRGSTRDINYAFNRKKKRLEEKKNFSAGLAMLSMTSAK